MSQSLRTTGGYIRYSQVRYKLTSLQLMKGNYRRFCYSCFLQLWIDDEVCGIIG